MHSLVRLLEHHLPLPFQTDPNGESIPQENLMNTKPCMALDSESQSAYLSLSVNDESLTIYKTSTAKVIYLS